MDLFLFIVFPLGLIIGSFLNVIVDRVSRGESILLGRSYCELCKKKLKWYDLIPLISFIMLSGKCRYCHKKLSFYYPSIELLTGILFLTTALIVWNNYGGLSTSPSFDLQLIYYLFIISSLIVIFFTDLKYGIIPFTVVIPASILVFLWFFFLFPQLLFNHILSAVGAFFCFLLLFIITKGKESASET